MMEPKNATSLCLKLLILAAILISLPLMGVWSAGEQALGVYFHFPPEPGRIAHAPFSWPVFAALAAFILAFLAPFVLRGLKFSQYRDQSEAAAEGRPLPIWGWAGILICLAAWILAWTRLDWFRQWQPYTFPFLWIGYILVANAISCKRRGRCLLLQKPFFLFALFPASALFWWFFEYLNRFVLNWYYVQVDMFTPNEYISYASVCFATVLPAVWSTADLLESFPFFQRTYKNFIAIRPNRPKAAAGGVVLLAALGLFALGLFPNFLFPLLWISPLLIVICLQVLAGEQQVFSPLREGDWSRIVTFAAAALVCGFFWEMWNFYSLAKWEYSIPFVHRFQIFEMPLPGYAGYLPFGLECAAVGDMIQQAIPSRN
ncbi:MAG TPA: hypothetical protein VKO20_01235 [Desulfosalsimonadaceae bacterium]|nr:hypothetical protein [Desulfosalsimonadaceae bacterium]